MKNLIDTYFEAYYDFHSGAKVHEQSTRLAEFDLDDSAGSSVVAKGGGLASFNNLKQDEIKVLSYEKFVDDIKRKREYAQLKGKSVCDFIILDEETSTIILNELTSSNTGIENLKEPLLHRHKSYSKFEHVEKQLGDTLKMLYGVPKIGEYIDGIKRKLCLTSYKLYCGRHDAALAFDRPNQTLSRIAGENGVNISLPSVEKLGFKYYRISHEYSFTIS